MSKFIVKGGNKLVGKVQISPAKNSCLPIIASSIMFNGDFLIKKAPNISDLTVMAKLIENLGGSYRFCSEGLFFSTKSIEKFECDKLICKKARASFFTVGSLLSKFKRAILPLPGGCDIGERPVDIHINALGQIGVEVRAEGENLVFDGKNMRGGKIKLSYPSVGATVNCICALAFLKGESEIVNCAKEPEIVDLCNFLNYCGCKISGMGSAKITIEGISKHDCGLIEYLPIEDRIEAGTFTCMTAVSGGDVIFEFANFSHLRAVFKKLCRCGVECAYKNGEVRVSSNGKLKSNNLVADVFPSFPTDLQSLYCSVCAIANGKSIVKDNVFKGRFQFLKQLEKMGAKVVFKDNCVEIIGQKELHGALVTGCDLRSGAALISAGLCAKGVTVIENGDVIKRGYDGIDKKLSQLGANITLIG